MQNANGSFDLQSSSAWDGDKALEDMESIFFDADGDGDQDLYVVSGGNASRLNSTNYQDRLYINDGSGNFQKSNNALPNITSSGACVAAFDYDDDGDQDIFVGGRTSPGKYPTTPRSIILNNNQGKFTEVTPKIASGFENLGMVSDLQFGDLDGDGKQELIVVGEWVPISVFQFDGSKFKNVTSNFGLQNTSGWWNCFALIDIDKDGDMDIIAGNEGENTRLQASDNEPLMIYANDFDGNGSLEPVLSYKWKGKTYPYAGRDNLIKQMPTIKRKYNRYVTYASADITQIFPADKLKQAQYLEAKILSNVWLKNEGGKFSISKLPNEAQLAPVHEILATDINSDGNVDVLLVGNNLGSETETSVYDASNGTLLLGDGKGGFKFSENRNHGLWASNQARDIVQIKSANGKNLILIANNEGKLQVYEQTGNEIPVQ